MEDAEAPVSTAFLADLFAISKQAIARLAGAGVFPKLSRGRFPLGETVRGYLDFKVAGEAARRGTGSSDRVRDARATQIEMRIAREDRELVTMEEATATLDEIAGAFITLVSGLPHRITRDPRERQRIEAIIDAERLRLSDTFAKTAKKLKAGQALVDADDEED